jgi:hydrogenase expression/formation protein HypE
MKTGKIAPELLEKLVFAHLGVKRDEVLVHASIGEDSSIIDAGEKLCVMSTDPITGATKGIGRYAVNISCNDVAANGAEPIGVMVTLLLPETSTEEEIESIMRELGQAARELDVEILGGHTEITTAVKEVIICCTAVGLVERERMVTSSGASPGDYIILTKWAGLEGTAILASEFEEQLIEALGASLVERAKGFIKDLSVVPEGRISAEYGVSAMHDVTEGGVLGALYELTEASKIGAELWFQEIPVREETMRICQHFQIDPFALISSGAMLIIANDGPGLVQALVKKGIPAKIIGKMTESGRNFRMVYRDELWRVLTD